MLQPIRAIQPMESDQQKCAREKLRTVTPPDRGRPQQQEACNKASYAFQNSDCPVIGSKPLRPAMLYVINHRQNQSYQRKAGINSAVQASHPDCHRHQEKENSGSLPHETGQIQPADRPCKKQHLANRGKRNAKPAGKPEAEITSLLITAEKEKQD